MNEPIKLDGKYKYRNGEPARVLCVDAPDKEDPVISITEDGTIYRHKPNGKYRQTAPNALDLIPDVPLWEGEIWVHPDKTTIMQSIHSDSPSWEMQIARDGYRKIKVREVERCQS